MTKVRDRRLDDKPGGWMLTHRIPTPGGNGLGKFLARCEACNIESVHEASHGECLRLAFVACNEHNNTHHTAAATAPAQGALF